VILELHPPNIDGQTLWEDSVNAAQVTVQTVDSMYAIANSQLQGGRHTYEISTCIPQQASVQIPQDIR
jgi:hypothetical protein